MLVIHILIALSSLVFSGITFLVPTLKKLYFSYTLVGLTIVSGTYLIISKPAHMLTVCFEGLLYIGVVSIALLFANKKLAKQV
ncbi:MAG TPA: hypothetical protein VF189_00675 [Patescibacteria group bacterium]